jgi:hypothetical protein
LTLTGADRASLTWWLDGWPALPDLGLPPQCRHALAEVTVNSRGIDELRPADHSVNVHVGGWDEEKPRADWLARQVGHSIDSAEWGW